MRTAASLVSAIVFALTPTVTFATGSGNCLDFDGVNDYAEGTGISTSLTNLTLETWVYHHTLPSNIERYVTVQSEVAVLRHDGVSQQGQLHFYIKTDGVQRDIRVNGSLQAGRWHHVAGTWDGTDMKLYLNGEEVGTLAPGGNLDAPSGDVRLSSSAEPIDGYLDEICIWSVARTPDEIRSNMYRGLSGYETGLESYWKLNGSSGSTAYDSAGSVHLTLYNMTNDDWVTSGAFSGPRNALDFDGSNDYVDVAQTAGLPIYNNGTDDAYTVSMWVKGGVQDIRRVFSEGSSGSNSPLFTIGSGAGSSDRVQIFIRDDGGATLLSATSTYAVFDGTWRHIAWVDSNGTATLYVDGKPDPTDFTYTRGTLTLDRTSIGAVLRASASHYFTGEIDEVRTLNVALTPLQIRENMCKTMAWNEGNLVGYWRFDQEEGATLYDIALNGNHGTLTNMADDDWVACDAFTTWIGCAGTDWATADNWSQGIVPNSTSTNVGIPDYWANDKPTMAGDYTCNHLSITSGAICTISSPWTLTLNGNAYSSGSTAGDGEIDLTGASAAHALAGTFENIELDEAGGAELAGDATINGALTLTNGTLTVGANMLTLKNALGGTATNLSADSTSSITIAGSGTGVNIPSSVTELNNLTLNNTNGTTQQDDLELYGTLTLTDGALSIATNALTLNGLISVGSGGLSGGSSSNIMFSGTGASTNLPAVSLNDLTINRSNGIGLAGDVIIDGTLTPTDGAFTIGANTLTLKNAIGGTATNLSAGNTSSIMIAGSGIGVNIPGSVTELNNLTLNNSNGTTLQNSLVLDGVLTLTSGAFSVGANTLTLKNPVAGTPTNLSAGNTSSITIAGSGTGVNIPSSVTELNNMTLNNTNGTTQQDDLELYGTLTLTDGALSIATNALTLNGSISVGSGGLSGGSSSNIMFSGTGASTNLPAVSLNDLTINRSNGIGLAGNVTIGGTVTLTNGDVDLNGHTLTLGATATLSEPDGNTVQGDSGAVTTTRTFNAGDLSAGENIAGMGAEITTDTGLGQTTVSRGHADQIGTALSVLRYYDITPTNNSGLNATLVFHYDDSELNGLTEFDLELGRSTDSGSTWSGEGGTVDTGNETITLSGIDALSRWSAFEPGFNNAISLTGVYDCSVAWGDYDSDGDLDVLMAGFSGGSRITRIYRNDESDTFTHTVSLTGIDHCSVAWGDYDNDGDLDVLMAGDVGGGRITRIYRNDAGVFTSYISLTGVSQSSVAWGDYDNDGDLDVLMAGFSTGSAGSQITRIYRNDGSDTFADAVSLPGVADCSVAWGDYDNDGDLDVLLAGWTASSRITRIYRNDGSDTFTNAVSLAGVQYCSVAWGDYDNDGDLDVLLAGYPGSGYVTRIYRNEGSGTFTDIGAGLTGVRFCSVAWGDYDNDGDLDVLMAGDSSSGHIARIYRNEGPGTFTDIGAGLTGVEECSVAWGDYDNDGDLDVLFAGRTASGYVTRIYRNDELAANTVPNTPSNLTASAAGQDVTLSWDKATDVETDQNALTYNLRIGTTSGGIETESPMANVSTGWRRIPALGNTNHDTTWVVRDLPGGVHYWSVQAIDNGFVGSNFSAEGTFSVIGITTASVTDITKTSATCGGEVTHDGSSSVTAKGVVWDTTENPTVGVHLGMTNDGSGLGSFVSYLTGLASGQTYYVRAYATNSVSTAYGEGKVFATNMIPPGNGLDFDGSDDYVNVAQTAGLPIYNNGTGDAYAVSMWVKGGSQNDMRVFSEGRSISNTPLFAIGTGSSDGVTLYIRDDGNATLLSATSTYPVFDSTWHHIAWVDSSGTATLYVDGKPDATDFSYTRGTLTLNRTGIGAVLRGSPSYFFTGEIDEICLWNTARSESDIRSDMNKALNGDEAGLVAYYRFDHLSGTALSDRTTNDNDGMLMNMDDADWVTSTASIGHESHIGTGTGNLSENVDVPVDVTWDADPGTDAIFAAIQVDDAPDVTTGLPAHYDSTYWELWIAHDDGSWQTDAAFHYDNVNGISDETTLALYTRAAPGQSWSLVAGTTVDYEGSTSDGVGSITANDLTAFSQFIIGGSQEMTLTGTVQLDTLVLEWSTVPPASGYWVYGAFNEPYFAPQAESPFGYRLTVTADTTWSCPAGIADPDTNWTYQVIAVDGSDSEFGRTNRFGEHEFELP